MNNPKRNPSEPALDSIEQVDAGEEIVALRGLKYVPGAIWGEEMPVYASFTDHFGDSWYLDPDRRLLLLTPRHIDQADDQFDSGM
jgi:hypothetical protein